MIDEGWCRIIRIMGEAFDAYERGLVALRRRVVDDVRRKLSDRRVSIPEICVASRDRVGHVSGDSMLTALILLAQPGCAPTVTDSVGYYDPQKGGAAVTTT